MQTDVLLVGVETMKQLRKIIHYVLLSCFIADMIAFLFLPFVKEYNPAFFFIFIYPLDLVIFRYDEHRHYLTNWCYVYFEWRFRWF